MSTLPQPGTPIPEEDSSAIIHCSNSLIAGLLGLVLALAIAWVLALGDTQQSGLFALATTVTASLFGLVTSFCDGRQRIGLPAIIGFRHLLDLAIRLLLLAWLVSWAYTSYTAYVEVEKAKKALKPAEIKPQNLRNPFWKE